MASIHIFQNKQTRDIVLCPFARCVELGGGSVASGDLIYLCLDEFIRNGPAIVTKEFESFDTRDSSIKSELYDLMAPSERNRFLSMHAKVILSWPIKSDPVNVYIGDNNELYGTMTFPFDKATFADYILGAIAKAG